MKVLAQILPLTHAVTVSRAVFYGEVTTGLWPDICYLMVLEIIAFYAGVKLMKRRLIK